MPHIHDSIDFSSTVFVVFEDKVLLRKHDKHKDWFGVGGHIELHEDPNEAAVREVKEEVGLDVELLGEARQFPDHPEDRELIPPRFLNKHPINDRHFHVDLIYFARARNDEVAQGEKELSDGIRWFTREEIENAPDLRDKIRFYALAALRAAAANKK